MGLDHIHNDHHITHRDLKPSNILIYDDKILKISGYAGAKKHVEEPPVVSKKKEGNYLYAAPEVLNQDVREVLPPYVQDIYSVGMIACDMMAKELPQRVDIANKNIKFDIVYSP